MKIKKLICSVLSLAIIITLASGFASAGAAAITRDDVTASGGSVFYDKWSASQYSGDFTDADGKTFTGIGMYASIGSSSKTGTAYVEIAIPAAATQFTCYVTAEKNWCSTDRYGTSTFVIYLDGSPVYSKTLTETIPAEFVSVDITGGAKVLRLEVQQNWKNMSGNHACIWGDATFDAKDAPVGDTPWSAASEWAVPELKAAAEAGLIPDTLIGQDLTKPITRAEFAAVAVRLYETWSGNTTSAVSAPFTDIGSDTNREEILKAFELGVTNGTSATTFEPSLCISREQLATMLCRVYKKKEWTHWTLATDDNFTLNYSGVDKFTDDAEISEYAKPSVYFMVKYGVINGVGGGMFAPRNVTSAQEAIGYATATREQAVLMSLRSFEKLN